MRTGAPSAVMKGLRSEVAALLLLILLMPLQARAEEVETTIEAVHLEYSEGVYRLSGEVRIERLDAVLEADRVVYNEVTGEARASGRVRYEDGWVLIEAEKADMNLVTKRGRIHNAHLLFKEDNYHVRAEEIERRDEGFYVVKEATFTTCDAPLPEWCFDAERADVRLGDRLRARGVVFRIRGLPVLYSPLLHAPIQTERKSGLLLPEVGFSSDKGLFWRQPLYLVLSENRDATLRLDYYGRKGWAEGVEYRYIERGIGRGEWWFYHLRERGSGKDLFEVKGGHYNFRSEGLSGFLDLNYVSDRAFYREYSRRVELRTRRFLESIGEVSYPFGKGRVYIVGRAWQDLAEDGDTGDVLQKVPEAGLSLYPARSGPLYLALDASFANFYSENLQRVQRFDIHPRAYHTGGDAIRLSQSLGLRWTLYRVGNSDDFPDATARGSIDYSVRLHARVMKGYGGVTHIVEPEAGYRFIPATGADVPLLDSTELYDRVSEVSVGLRNYLFDGRGRIASVRLTGVYDLHSGERPLLRLEAALSRPLRISLDASYDPGSGGFEWINYSTSFKAGRTSFSVGQRYSRRDEILFYTGGFSMPLTRRWSLSSTAWYDARGEGLRDLKVTTVYSAQCWGLRLTYNRRPDDYSIFLVIELKGLGSMRLVGI